MVTLKQVADQSGVHVMTASRALRGMSCVRENTRKRVEEVARELGYRLNVSAQSVRTGRFGGIGLLMATDRNQSFLPDGLIRGLQDALGERDMHLTVSGLPSQDSVSAHPIPKLIRRLMVDALLINYTRALPAELDRMVDDLAIPKLWLNTKRAYNCLYPDDYDSGFNGTRKLIEMGYTRIGYAHCGQTVDDLINKPAHYSWRERYLGYCDAMSEADLEPEFLDPEAKLFKISLNDFASTMKNKNLPDAIFCYHSFVAHRYSIASMINGLSIPDDLALVTVGGKELNGFGFRVATAVCERYNSGKDAITHIVDRLSDSKVQEPPIALPYVFDFSPITNKCSVKSDLD